MGTPNNSSALAAEARGEKYFDEIAAERDAWMKSSGFAADIPMSWTSSVRCRMGRAREMRHQGDIQTAL